MSEVLEQAFAVTEKSSWQIKTLGEVCRTSSGGTPSRSRPDYFNGRIPWVKSGELTDGLVSEISEFISEEALAGSSAKLLPAGTLLIAMYGATVGKLGVLARAAATNQAVCAIFPPPELDPKFLFWYLRRQRSNLIAKAVGGAQPNISQTILRDLELPIPPLGEQREIVAEIEKQLSRLDEAVANLQRVKANLKRYKAAVLKAAVEGRLVETEASLAHREGRSYETGEQLLQRILETRRTQWAGRGRYKEPGVLRAGVLAALPEGWTWTTLGACFNVVVGATPVRSEAAYWKGGIPWVSSGEVQFRRISATREHISAQGLANSSTQINPAGSVLLAMIGQGRTRGQVALLDIDAANNQNSAAIWVSLTPVPSEYVYYWLMGRYEETRRAGSGNNQQAMNKAIVEAMPLPLPPLAEIHRVVAELDRRLSILQGIEVEVDANLQRAQRLRQSTLAKAFAPNGLM